MKPAIPDDPEKEVSRPGDATKRIVLFLSSSFFGALAGAGLFAGEYGFALLFGLPALAGAAIAFWGNRKAVEVAKEVTDISNLTP